MWLPVGGRRFDLIVANLPHFPMERSADPGPPAELERRRRRRPALLDPFLEGLAGHLAPGGRALITHNAFVGLDRSRADRRRGYGLSLRVA